MRWIPIFLLGVLLLLGLSDAVWACPTCKDGLSESQANMARGYFWSILFMMSMPFLILAGLGAYFYWEVRKAKARQQAQTKVVEVEELPVSV